jgi:hypothetical protein
MSYFRYLVTSGEFVIRGPDHWRITFNGVQIGGACRTPEEAIAMIARSRHGEIVGPHLTDVPDPAEDLAAWQSGNQANA